MRERRDDLNPQESGQALFEFIIFLPLLMYLVTVLINSGNAINASINQQKATRGYAYTNLLLSNSTFPTAEDLRIYTQAGATQSAVFVIGYGAFKSAGSGNDQYGGSCYKYNRIPGAQIPQEECEDQNVEVITDFVRVFTFYGLCGETYKIDNNVYTRSYFQRGFGSCIIK